MIAACRSTAKLIGLLLCLFPVLSSCRGESRLYSTWASLGERPGRSAVIAAESVLPGDAHPWAGTVSHHLLAGVQIDDWFRELAARRSVSVFYVLSPSHWGLSTQDWSLTDGAWRVSDGVVRSDIGEVRRLAKNLGVPLERSVFDGEHGVSTLMPYISRYFPGARVLVIAYHGEPPLDQAMAEKLTEALAPAFSQDGKKRNFLLISADFAHHGNYEGTAVKDARTARFFSDPSQENWIFAGCDNRPGMYALSRYLTPDSRCSVLYHTNSFALSGKGSDDITSYFFTYFWDSIP